MPTNLKLIVKNILLLLLVINLYSCKKDIALVDATSFPNEINTIMNTRCSTSGCHNKKSAAAAGGLNLETWNDMLKGGNGGSIVIPFRSNRSWLSFYINTFPELGISLNPTMPVNQEHLSKEEVIIIQKWIDSGAPNSNRDIPFPTVERDKFYITNQGCDEVAVIDTKTKLVIRYIKVGLTNSVELPHKVVVSPDKKYWYVTFNGGSVVQKFDAFTDKLVGNIPVPFGLYNGLVISGNGKYGVITDLQSQGHVIYLDLDNLSVIYDDYDFDSPHGLGCTSDFSVIYFTLQNSNKIVKVIFNTNTNQIESREEIDLVQNVSTVSPLNPHEIIFSPDYSKYYVSCQITPSVNGEVRVYKASNDSLIEVIPVGIYPQEFAISASLPYLFVTCTEDANPNPKSRGSVYAINYNTFQVVKILKEQLFQPHGIACDDKNNIVIVANRNIDTNGPAPHHSSDCGGRNGYVRAIDLNTLEFISGYKSELSVDPYSVSALVHD
jgi:YVTN family beta-propeller protein